MSLSISEGFLRIWIVLISWESPIKILILCLKILNKTWWLFSFKPYTEVGLVGAKVHVGGGKQQADPLLKSSAVWEVRAANGSVYSGHLITWIEMIKQELDRLLFLTNFKPLSLGWVILWMIWSFSGERDTRKKKPLECRYRLGTLQCAVLLNPHNSCAKVSASPFYTCGKQVRQFVKMLSKQWMAKLGCKLRASLTPQPMHFLWATVAQATILNWHSNSLSGLKSPDSGIFSQKSLLNLRLCWLGWLRSVFSMATTGYKLEAGTWLGCGSRGHWACCHSLPWCTTQMKCRVRCFEVPFLWE